jgi:hypothetical protein
LRGRAQGFRVLPLAGRIEREFKSLKGPMM